VIPTEHDLDLMRLQEPLAAEVAEDSFANRVLQILQQLGCEDRGFVEAEMVVLEG